MGLGVGPDPKDLAKVRPNVAVAVRVFDARFGREAVRDFVEDRLPDLGGLAPEDVGPREPDHAVLGVAEPEGLANPRAPALPPRPAYGLSGPGGRILQPPKTPAGEVASDGGAGDLFGGDEAGGLHGLDTNPG